MINKFINTVLAASTENPAIKALPTNKDIFEVFKDVSNVLSVIAGMLAFIYLIYSGILYLTASGNPDNAKKGQQGVVNAVIGIVVIVAAWTIIRAVSGSTTSALQGGKI